MTKLKNFAVLLMAFLLVVAGGVLPLAVAFAQDHIAAGQVEYADVESLQLTLEEEKVALGMLQKMDLICNGIGVEVTSEVTNMNGKDILEIMYDQLLPYSQFGLFAELDNDFLEFYPVMVYDEADPDIYNFYWYVHMSFDVSENDYLTVVLDDETGKILALECINPESYTSPKVLWEFQEAIGAIYFSNLELDPVNVMPVDSEGILSETMETVDGEGDSHAVMRYQFADVAYGAVNVEIWVHTNGFAIYLDVD